MKRFRTIGRQPTQVAILAIALGLLTVGGAFLAVVLRQAAPAASVDGRILGPAISVHDWLDARRERLRFRTVAVGVDDRFEDVALAEFGIEPNVEATAQAVALAGELSLWSRVAACFGRLPTHHDVSFRWRVDQRRLRERLQAYAPLVHRAPVSARVDLTRHERIDDAPGVDLDEDATVQALQRLPHEDEDVLPLVLRALPAAVTSATLANVDVTKILSAQETKFSRSGTGAGRAVNILTAAKNLDGFVLGPGETMSFNDVVGPRTEARGFTHAPEIVDDEMQDGVGGGTCQVASTVHAAAVFGGLEIVVRRSHRRPSSYIPLGLDATVVYGAVDLKVRNPYSLPVIFHVFLPHSTALRAEILGLIPTATVTYRIAVKEREEFFRRITYKPELPPGQTVLHQKGRQGMKVFSIVTTSDADGRSSERWYKSEYFPVPEVFWVGPGANERDLPALPEGAVGVERRGALQQLAFPWSNSPLKWRVSKGNLL